MQQFAITMEPELYLPRQHSRLEIIPMREPLLVSTFA